MGNQYKNGPKKLVFQHIDLIIAEPENLVNMSQKNAKIWSECNKGNKKEFKLTMTSVRKIFSEIKRIDLKKNTFKNDDQLKTEIIYLKPILAYQGGRAKYNVRGFFAHLIELVDQQYKNFSEENFKKFVKYIESLISFYKMEGGE